MFADLKSAKSLTDLAIKYSCDKYYQHSYIDSGFYEKLFAGRDVRKFLEIGIGYEALMAPLVPKYIHGASLRMWEEYFPHADIFSCDIRSDTLVNEGRIRSVCCDQYDASSLQKMITAFWSWRRVFDDRGFDVIIDDGCHHTLAQVISFYTLWPYLNHGGVYVVEDVGYPEILAKAIGGEIHVFRKNGRWDDVLVTKEK